MSATVEQLLSAVEQLKSVVEAGHNEQAQLISQAISLSTVNKTRLDNLNFSPGTVVQDALASPAGQSVLLEALSSGIETIVSRDLGPAGKLSWVGETKLTLDNSAHSKWADLDGSVLSAAAHPHLASVLGAVGDDVTLPDWRGRTLGVANGTSYLIGGVAGLGTLSEHAHTYDRLIETDQIQTITGPGLNDAINFLTTSILTLGAEDLEAANVPITEEAVGELTSATGDADAEAHRSPTVFVRAIMRIL